MSRRALALLAELGLGAAALAQPQTQGTATYTLSWSEFHIGSNGWINAVAGNANGGSAGVVEPWLGEGALFKITMTMSGTPAGDGTGTPLTWDPSVAAGSSGSGTLSGFWSGDIDLVGDGGAATASGTWSDNTTNYAAATRRRLLNFTDSGNNGTVEAGGARVGHIVPSQLGFDAAFLLHSNGVTVFQGLWIPSTLVNAPTSWHVVLGPLGTLSRVAARDSLYGSGVTSPIALNVSTAFGAGVNIPWIVPTPGVAALLLAGAGYGAARRRRGCVCDIRAADARVSASPRTEL